MTYETTTNGSNATQQLAAKLAPLLHGGEVIELVSDLGGGKTTFVQGLMKALGYTGHVTSPTFTVAQSYDLNDQLSVHHYDLYRLTSAGVIGQELAEDLEDNKVITIIEWPGLIEHNLPPDRLTIHLEVVDDEARRILVTSGGMVSDAIIEGLKA